MLLSLLSTKIACKTLAQKLGQSKTNQTRMQQVPRPVFPKIVFLLKNFMVCPHFWNIVPTSGKILGYTQRGIPVCILHDFSLCFHHMIRSSTINVSKTQIKNLNLFSQQIFFTTLMTGNFSNSVRYQIQNSLD